MSRRNDSLDKITRRNYTGDVDEILWLVAETNHGTNQDIWKCSWQTKLESNRNHQMKTPKIAIYIKGGMVEAIRSNISPELEIEIVDADCEQLDYEDRWEEIQTELNFGNY